MSSQTVAPSLGKLTPGDYAPWFKAAVLDGRPDWVFHSSAGVPTLLFLYGQAGHAANAAALDLITARTDLFDGARVLFFGVTIDPGDAAQARITQHLPGIRHFLDYDRAISRAYGAIDEAAGTYHPHILLLDTALQVVGSYPPERADQAIAALEQHRADPPQDWAPVLTINNLFEPELRAMLIDLHAKGNAFESGFMREVKGKTTLVSDPNFKQRRDVMIEDAALRRHLEVRIARRLVPAIQRAFQFSATRIERYLVAAYDADTGGHFRPHRDNTTKGTAHRRFAVTVNLNDDYDGGDLRFPEYGARTYRAPPGSAIVFGCSLLHEATPVTRGRRYAFLPFLYDDAAAAIREANFSHVDTSTEALKVG